VGEQIAVVLGGLLIEAQFVCQRVEVRRLRRSTAKQAQQLRDRLRVLQFSEFLIRLDDGAAVVRGPRPHGHTAIVLDNLGNGTLRVAEQNMTDWGTMLNPHTTQVGMIYLTQGVSTSRGQTVTRVQWPDPGVPCAAAKLTRVRVSCAAAADPAGRGR
jgi:hypothetical protein